MALFSKRLPSRRHVVTLRFEGRDYKLRAGDVFETVFNLSVEPMPGSDARVDVSGVVKGKVKIVSIT